MVGLHDSHFSVVGDPIRWSQSKFGISQNEHSISVSYIGVGIYIKCTGKEDDITECEQFDVTYCSTITTLKCSNSCTTDDIRLNSSSGRFKHALIVQIELGTLIITRVLHCMCIC